MARKIYCIHNRVGSSRNHFIKFILPKLTYLVITTAITPVATKVTMIFPQMSIFKYGLSSEMVNQRIDCTAEVLKYVAAWNQIV